MPDDSTSIKDQLEKAVRDLWSMLEESGDDYVVFMDRRRLHTRVQRVPVGTFAVTWEPDEEGRDWITYGQEFDNPREAAFHAYQGPH